MDRHSLTYNKGQYAYPTLVVIFCSLFLTLATSRVDAAAGETLIDEIVAVVDSQPILHSEVQEKVKVGPLVMVSDFPATEKSPQYERALFDSINYALVLKQIEDLEIAISEEEVDAKIENVLKSQGLTKTNLYQFLEKEGKTLEDYKEDFRRQMLLSRFQGRVIAPMIKVTDKDIETFYLKKSGNNADDVKLTLRQILIRIPADASADIKKAKKALSREVFQRLSGGMNFEEAVKIYSDGPNARSNGGLMKGIGLTDLSKEIQVGVGELAENEFTNPIQTALGFHIFFLEEKKFSGSDEYMSQKRQLEYELRNQELSNQTRRWIQEARQKAKIKVLRKVQNS